MDAADAKTALANARAWIESQAMDARAKGQIEPRTEEGLALVFGLELLLSQCQDAPEPIRRRIIETIANGVNGLEVARGHVQH